jgi:hypothetical protein
MAPAFGRMQVGQDRAGEVREVSCFLGWVLRLLGVPIPEGLVPQGVGEDGGASIESAANAADRR